MRESGSPSFTRVSLGIQQQVQPGLERPRIFRRANSFCVITCQIELVIKWAKIAGARRRGDWLWPLLARLVRFVWSRLAPSAKAPARRYPDGQTELRSCSPILNICSHMCCRFRWMPVNGNTTRKMRLTNSKATRSDLEFAKQTPRMSRSTARSEL